MEKLLRGCSDARESRDKTRFARLTRSIINALAVVLGLLVAYSQIKDIRPDALLTTSSADIDWRAALVFYYWSWVAGAKFDTNIRELAYVAFPGQGKWPLQPYAVFMIFVVMAAILPKIIPKYHAFFFGVNRIFCSFIMRCGFTCADFFGSRLMTCGSTHASREKVLRCNGV